MKNEPPTEYEIALATTPTPAPSQPAELDLLEALEDTGAEFPNPAAALRAIESAFDQAGDKRAAETLATIFSRLPGGRRGAELRAALLAINDGTGAETARAFGVSPQSWNKQAQRLRARLCEKRLIPPASLGKR